jgi:hypothetical protein
MDFPSPLLDWTRSPYVAAYFAFANAAHSDSVSIYVLSEVVNVSDADADGKRRSIGVPNIYRVGSNVKSARRHFIQQCDYTMCLLTTGQEGSVFAKHDLGLGSRDFQPGTRWNFDLKKFNIPSGEQQQVLRRLDEHNLNAFSLFGSDESFFEMMAWRNLLDQLRAVN